MFAIIDFRMTKISLNERMLKILLIILKSFHLSRDHLERESNKIQCKTGEILEQIRHVTNGITF